VSHALGEAVAPPEPKQPSKEALEAHLADLRERCQQICFILENGNLDELSYQGAELRSELAVHREMAAATERQLNPDPGAAELQRQFAEGLALQARQMAARHAPPEPAVLAERRANMLKRRTAIIDARYNEDARVTALQHRPARSLWRLSPSEAVTDSVGGFKGAARSGGPGLDDSAS
jgi:hypothetical protein